MERHGQWRGPYEEGSLYFYIDEYIKDAPKDLLAVLSTTADWLSRELKKQSTLVEDNITALRERLAAPLLGSVPRITGGQPACAPAAGWSASAWWRT